MRSENHAQPPTDAWLARQWAVTPQQFSVDVDGAPIACLGWNEHSSELPGLILVHGFRAHARWWDHIAPSFLDHFRVVALDLSGMGDSGHRAQYSRRQHGREIAAVAAACGFQQPTVVAHSYGGIATLISAADHPNAYRAIVVIDSVMPLPKDRERPARVVGRNVYPSREAAIDRFSVRPPGRWPIPAVVAHIARHSIRETADGWVWKFDPNATETLNIERASFALAPVQVPASYMYAEFSEVVTPERIALTSVIMPRMARPIVLPLCHHHVMIEQPLILVAALRAVLAEAARESPQPHPSIA